MSTTNTMAELQEEYAALMHAMQTGVACSRGSDMTPKHLRVGVNSVRVGLDAMLGLLTDKGICTEQEYMYRLVFAMREEVKRYEAELGAQLL